MAKKRMFSREVVDSDAFLKMSPAAQLFYFRLVLNADDDGCVDSARSQLLLFGFGEEELSELCRSGFTDELPDGVVLILHWHVHNKIPRLIYTPSRYARWLSGFRVNSEGVYERCEERAEKAVEPHEEDFLNIKIAELFIKCGYQSSPDEFIAYNEARGWRGVGGEDVRKNYERYAEAWESNYRARHGLPPRED